MDVFHKLAGSVAIGVLALPTACSGDLDGAIEPTSRATRAGQPSPDVVTAGPSPGFQATKSPAKGIPTTDVQPSEPAEADGIGDPYYPKDGNPGFDARRYAVELTYDPTTTDIVAATVVAARATARLSKFNLDFRGMHIDSITVNGEPAAFSRSGRELTITPTKPVVEGARFLTRVRYHGNLNYETKQTKLTVWRLSATKGSGFIAGQPRACISWYPCNDHPSDMARFSLQVTVPRPFSVVSNGEQLPTLSPSGRLRTFRWRLTRPTPTFATTMYVDRLTFDRSTLPNGVEVIDAYGPKTGGAVAREARLPEVISFLERRFGPYPAPQAGGIFIGISFGFSLETYTRPLYTKGIGLSTIVHENAHQWWGDTISIKHWSDICLSECIASYSEWLWREHNGVELDQVYRDQIRRHPGYFDFPLHDMGRGHEFDYEGVFVKGRWFVHALRHKINAQNQTGLSFFDAIGAIQRARAGEAMSMIGLRKALERRTGVDLKDFWRDWVLDAGVPSRANLYPGRLASER